MKINVFLKRTKIYGLKEEKLSETTKTGEKPRKYFVRHHELSRDEEK